MINSVGTKYTIWAQGLLRTPHKYSKCVCSTTYSGIAREQRKGPSHLLYSWSAGGLGGRRKKEGKKGSTNQAPRPGLPLVPWAPVVQASFLSLSEQSSFPAYAVPSAWKTISLPLHLRTPTYSSPKIPLSQGCLPSTPTVSLPTLPVVLFVASITIVI